MADLIQVVRALSGAKPQQVQDTKHAVQGFAMLFCLFAVLLFVLCAFFFVLHQLGLVEITVSSFLES
ncbi:hypothetical protein ABMC88_11320 [Sulfitobacter sp. HNIBRBA2951]|uniref:hypothetical protein n=1 Tax=Sulfitobacter aquimarinus TaxID=3158557 RepID=UPI0032DFD096